VSIQWQQLIKKRAADRLVHSVMASDVFANNFRFTAQIKNSCGMNSAGARKIALRLTQFFRKR